MSTQNYSMDLFGTPEPLPDITAGKHGGNKHSVAANERISPHKDSVRERVRLQIAACGWQGLTINELKVWHETRGRYRYPNELSPRLTELSADGKIYDSGRDRDGCTVWVSDKRWVNGGAE